MNIRDLVKASKIVFCQSAKQLQAVLEAIRHNFRVLFDSYRSGEWDWEKNSLDGSRLSAYEEVNSFKYIVYLYPVYIVSLSTIVGVENLWVPKNMPLLLLFIELLFSTTE